MATTLRLAPDLESRAKSHAASIGVSLNALVSVALDAYLRPGHNAPIEPRNNAPGADHAAPVPTLPPPAHPAPTPQPSPPAPANWRPGKAKKKARR
ncbi:toxin-antitoxin system HicB family antitoxin [Hydrogenophaga sp.]|uniref:toxin-antitoxin system HicB family antitoxin n=1 Tax=Hydrogenophaga sp. TaxID=1904254 RepID=UPI003AF50281